PVTAVQGVVFDVGGVLERIDQVTFLDRWQERLGVSDAAMADALAHVDPENAGPVGGIDEYEVRRQYQPPSGSTTGRPTSSSATSGTGTAVSSTTI
ncbi:MAG TPA: hypothetical protein VH857_09290, partial [Actinomycetes bacterium]|nr:hypothetical protein [Actinomycetes bacterium]